MIDQILGKNHGHGRRAKMMAQMGHPYPRLEFKIGSLQTSTDWAPRDFTEILGGTWAIHVCPKWPLFVS